MDKRRKKSRKKKSKFKVILILLLIIAVVIGGYSLYNSAFGSVNIEEETVVEIPEASATGEIAQILEDNGIINSSFFFETMVKLKGCGGDLKAGRYHFEGEYSLSDVIECLKSGPAISGIKVTIPEGYNQKEIIALLVENNLCTEESFLAAVGDDYGYDYLPAAGESTRLQGYLFPDTYYFNEGATAHELIAQMLAQFDSTFTQEWRDALAAKGQSVNDWVTMASIVEKEAAVDTDRPVIASVFYNRIAQGMYLQSCATVQYALGETKSVLSYEDTTIDSPYNTYINQGLPPGPIASPGAASLEAALYPDTTDYLFFVAKGDGSHVFTRTYEEHIKAQEDIAAGLYD